MQIVPKTAPVVTDYFLSDADQVWHKLYSEDGCDCIADCGYRQRNCNAQITPCVYIGFRCPRCFLKGEMFKIEQCGV